MTSHKKSTTRGLREAQQKQVTVNDVVELCSTFTICLIRFCNGTLFKSANAIQKMIKTKQNMNFALQGC